MCSCVCREWNGIISRYLGEKRDQLSVHDDIRLEFQFRYRKNRKVDPHYTIICPIPVNKNILVLDHINEIIEIFTNSGKWVPSDDKMGNKFGRFSSFGMCCIDERIFTTNRLHQIRVYDLFYKWIATFSFIHYNLGSICSSNQGEILVRTDKNLILVLNKEVEVTNVVHIPPSENKRCLTDSICCNSRNEIIIGDWVNRKILILSEKGILLNSFVVAKYNEITCPMGICIDYKDNILVTDPTDKAINVFTPSGALIRKIGTIPDIEQLCILNRRMFVTTKYSICVFSN